MINTLGEHKYQHEVSKQDYHLLKQLLEQNKLPKLLDTIEIIYSDYSQTIYDRQLGENYSNEYKNDLMILLVHTAEVYMKERQKLFDDDLDKLWQEQCSLPIKKRLYPKVLYFLDQRFENIIRKVDCIFQYKKNSFSLF